MTWTLIAAIWWTLFAGLTLMMARDLLRAMLGLMVVGSGVNLMIFVAGRAGPAAPAVVPLGEQALAAGAANPVPQALVLTAIVIGLALACFAFVLILSLARSVGTLDGPRLRLSEPVPDHPYYPPVTGPEADAAKDRGPAPVPEAPR